MGDARWAFLWYTQQAAMFRGSEKWSGQKPTECQVGDRLLIGRPRMEDDVHYNRKGVLLAALLGAVGGGLAVALVARALPRMMAACMPAEMQEMMAEMRAAGHDPAEI